MAVQIHLSHGTALSPSMKPETSQKRLKSGEQNYRKQKLWKSDIINVKTLLPEAEKYRLGQGDIVVE